MSRHVTGLVRCILKQPADIARFRRLDFFEIHQPGLDRAG